MGEHDHREVRQPEIEGRILIVIPESDIVLLDGERLNFESACGEIFEEAAPCTGAASLSDQVVDLGCDSSRDYQTTHLSLENFPHHAVTAF